MFNVNAGDQYRITDRGAFRLQIWEAARRPAGLVKWSVGVYIPSLEWWYLLERDYNGVTHDVAEARGLERLEHWATTYSGGDASRLLTPTAFE